MKLIKINEFSYIETDDLETINKAELEGFEIIDILNNPDDYDDSLTDEQIKLKLANNDESNIRPERISKVRQKERKISLESLNNKEINK